MTALLTLTDDTYSANSSDGRKRLYGSVSLTNPYTAGGELITTSTYFGASNAKLDGGNVMMVNPSVAIALAGVLATGKFRGDNSSTTTVALQFFNAGLSGTANAGLFVDNTTANISAGTVFIELIGR